MSIAVIILTYNEERHIRRALSSVIGFANEICIIDSFSTDRTAVIAAEMGARVLNVKFVNFAQKFQWGLDNVSFTSDWVLRLDADEIVDERLVQEIRTRLPRLPSSVVGININRQYVFMNRLIRYGGRNPLIQLRLWRRGQGRIEHRWLDEHIVVSNGNTVVFSGGVIDHNLSDLTDFVSKHNNYATREAIEVLCQRFGLKAVPEQLSTKQTRQAAVKRFVKAHIYNHLPLGSGPFLYFLYRYILRLGFLDGTPGLIYHFLQGYWYRFLVNAKIYELEKALVGISDKNKIKAELTRLTKLPL